MTSPSDRHHHGQHRRHHLQKQLLDRWMLMLVFGTIGIVVALILLQEHPSFGSVTKLALSQQGSYDSMGSRIRMQFHTTTTTASSSSFDSNSSSNSNSQNNVRTATFKIMQIADIHLGEASQTDWVPLQDVETWRVLDRLIPIEKPDLIVLTGDQLTANNVNENATSYYRLLGQRLSYHGVPWALIFGNHDDAPYEVGPLSNGTILQYPAKTSRSDLLAVDQQFPLSLTQARRPRTTNTNSNSSSSSSSLFGTSNYVLNVYYPSSWLRDFSRDVAVQLFFFDSGGGALPKQLEQNQLEWFQTEHRKDVAGSVAFMHIPTLDFAYKTSKSNKRALRKKKKIVNNNVNIIDVGEDDALICQGLHDDQPVDAMDTDPGILEVLQNAGNVQWLAAGHNHGNGYCCPTTTTVAADSSSSSHNNNNTVHVCFGRHSGYGGYGTWDRGIRMYELGLERPPISLSSRSASSSSHDNDVSLTWKSWVRMENGTIQDLYEPFINNKGTTAGGGGGGTR